MLFFFSLSRTFTCLNYLDVNKYYAKLVFTVSKNESDVTTGVTSS